jgi:hypothetical protein
MATRTPIDHVGVAPAELPGSASVGRSATLCLGWRWQEGAMQKDLSKTCLTLSLSVCWVSPLPLPQPTATIHHTSAQSALLAPSVATRTPIDHVACGTG